LGKNKLDVRWASGIWLGVLEDSGEYLLGTRHGIAKARSFKRKSTDQDRWQFDELSSFKGSPWEPYPGDSLTYRSLKPKVTFEGSEKIADAPTASSKVGRIIRFQIRKTDIKKYGATKGCGGCAAAIRGSASKHTEECYSRFRDALETDGDPRITRYVQRSTEASSSHAEPTVEEAAGDDFADQVRKKFPKRVKKRRKVKIVSAEQNKAAEATENESEKQSDEGWEEYYDYIFPEDEAASGAGRNMKLLQMAAKWK
jgi:hypothetical protein